MNENLFADRAVACYLLGFSAAFGGIGRVGYRAGLRPQLRPDCSGMGGRFHRNVQRKGIRRSNVEYLCYDCLGEGITVSHDAMQGIHSVRRALEAGHAGLLTPEDHARLRATTLLIAGCGADSVIASSAARLDFERPGDHLHPASVIGFEWNARSLSPECVAAFIGMRNSTA